MTGSSTAFGKRGQGSVQRMGKRPMASRPRQASRPSAKPPGVRRQASQATSSSATDEPFLRVEAGIKEITIATLAIILGGGILGYMPDPGALVTIVAVAFVAGGALIAANLFTGRATFLADETGFGNESLLGNRHMRWEDVEAFQVTTVNFATTVNARASSNRHPSSKHNVNVPTSVLKDKELTFVSNLLARRPEMAEPTVFVMKQVGAKKLLKKLME